MHWHFHFVGQKEFFLKKKLLEVEKLGGRRKGTKIETQHLLTRSQDKVSLESEWKNVDLCFPIIQHFFRKKY